VRIECARKEAQGVIERSDHGITASFLLKTKSKPPSPGCDKSMMMGSTKRGWALVIPEKARAQPLIGIRHPLLSSSLGLLPLGFFFFVHPLDSLDASFDIGPSLVPLLAVFKRSAFAITSPLRFDWNPSCYLPRQRCQRLSAMSCAVTVSLADLQDGGGTQIVG
jgi:hypothetical protein